MRAVLTTISVIIPAFNRERYLRDAIESVLRQSRPAQEIIVVDDGSTDGTADIARGYGDRVRVVSQDNQGCGPARNTALKLWTGELAAFLDSDDIWEESKLARQCELLEARPELDLVFCRMTPFISAEIGEGELPPLNPVARDACIASGMLVRRAAMERIGPFRGDLRVGEFVEWIGRARELGMRMEVVPEVLLRRRFHHGNMIRDDAAKVDYVRLLKQQLDRRRAAT